MISGKLSPAGRTLAGTATVAVAAAGLTSFVFLDGLLPWLTTASAVVLVAVVTLVALQVMRSAADELRASYATLDRSSRALERRLAERNVSLKEADDEIRHLGDVVARDLRTPLNNLMGFTGELEALRNGIFAKAAKALGGSPGVEDAATQAMRRDFDEALWFIRSSIAKMDRLIGAVIDLAEVARRELKAEVVDLDRLARTLATDITHRADKGGTRMAIGKLPTIVGDRLALEQILSNLLDNATKYLREDLPGHISITAAETEAGAIEIAVSDNGRGIAPEDQAGIFDLFRRAGVQTHSGDGIGLAVVRTLVRRIGGSVRVDSEPGRGSIFTVAIPKSPAT